MNINEMSDHMHELEAESASQTIGRMSMEANLNEDNGSFLSDQQNTDLWIRNYKNRIEENFIMSSNEKAGYIIWLNLKDNPPLTELKPKVLMPTKTKVEILNKMVLVAKRLIDQIGGRISKTFSEDFNFKDYQLTRLEYDWLKNIVVTKGECCMRPFYDAQDADDWHYLPVNNVLNPEVLISPFSLLCKIL